MNMIIKQYFYKNFAKLFTILIGLFLVSNVNANPILKKIKEVESQTGARVGVAIYDVKSNKTWNYNGDTRFPLMSTFKTFACAKLLDDVDKKKQFFKTSVIIKEDSLITWSPVTKNQIGKKFSLKQACSAAMIMSDNTAANIVLDGIKGPQALTQFMRSLGDNVTRLDRIEPYLNEAAQDDVRDTTTPTAIVKSLYEVLFGNALSENSKLQLKQWMQNNKVSDSLLRSVLPSGWLIADRSGAGGYGSRGITAAVWSDMHPPIVISIYLTQTKASFSVRNKAIADIGKEIFSFYH